MKNILFSILLCALLPAWGTIDRRTVVTRNNPAITTLDTLGSLTVGNGSIAATVDITGMQSFPQFYSRGIPLTTMSDWGWHSFPNADSLCHSETLRSMDLGQMHNQLYAVEYKDDSRNAAATQYYRVNPHRLNLGVVGLEMLGSDGHPIGATEITDICQQLNLWTGIINSHFNAGGHAYAVTTACLPDHDCIVYDISSDALASGDGRICLQLPYPTGRHSDDAADWTSSQLHTSSIVNRNVNHATIRHILDDAAYLIHVSWSGEAKLVHDGDHRFVIAPQSSHLSLAVSYTFDSATPQYSQSVDNLESLLDSVAAYWQNFWQSGGIVDFGLCTDQRAAELERRVVLSQYLTAINCSGSMPPQETGLTYNSWFGRPHLEMAWWHLVDHSLWGRSYILERQLQWYVDTALPVARQIAARQGCRGVRWMKMTDPTAGEAPSNTGSFLLWQQPHFIYLAEELYRTCQHDSILSKYADAVELTADFMASWATTASDSAGYLKGHTAMQESMRKDFSYGHPFEQAYWVYGLEKAQQWRLRRGLPRRTDWDSVLTRLAQPAVDGSGIYVAGLPLKPLSATASQQSFDPYVSAAVKSAADISAEDFWQKSHSDHPAVLGVAAIIPDMGLYDSADMSRTLYHVLDTWNWPTTWGWDYGMIALAAARLGHPDTAIEALLIGQTKNTCLVNGHNYQDSRLRVYLPGNGALLTAVAAMCAGWDGAPKRPNPGFPASWPVQWEGLRPIQ